MDTVMTTATQDADVRRVVIETVAVDVMRLQLVGLVRVCAAFLASITGGGLRLLSQFLPIWRVLLDAALPARVVLATVDVASRVRRIARANAELTHEVHNVLLGYIEFAGNLLSRAALVLDFGAQPVSVLVSLGVRLHSRVIAFCRHRRFLPLCMPSNSIAQTGAIGK